MFSTSDPVRGVRRAGLGAALTLAVVLAAAAPGRAVDGVREISAAAASAGGVTPGDAPGYPVTLSEPGSYVLTGSLVTTGTDVAIEITADDVTLDLNGFALECRVFLSLPCSSGGIGISGAGGNAARVLNGTVRGFGSVGMSLGDSAHVERVQVIDNGGTGIVLGEGARVESCVARGNGHSGIVVGIDSRVRDALALRNGLVGISAGPGAVITHSVAGKNGGVGIQATSWATVVGNAASENGGDGIRANAGSTVADNASNLNGGDGFDLGWSGTSTEQGGLVRGNTANGNDDLGIHMDPAWGYSGNVVTDNAGGNGSPQTTGGVALGSNLCGTTVGCP